MSIRATHRPARRAELGTRKAQAHPGNGKWREIRRSALTPGRAFHVVFRCRGLRCAHLPGFFPTGAARRDLVALEVSMQKHFACAVGLAITLISLGCGSTKTNAPPAASSATETTAPMILTAS